MDKEQLKNLLKNIKNGKISIDNALEKLKILPFHDINFAKIDTHRSLRCGFPEVIFCQGKTIEQITTIISHMIKRKGSILATRVDEKVYKIIKKIYPIAEYNKLGRTIVIRKEKEKKNKGIILIITGGTADIPIAEEAFVTAEVMGNNVEKIYDVGVAGIHRLLTYHDKLNKANVIIVVAGMDGALASVVGGLVTKPVIAVPTSIGYGANFFGLAPLLTMLNNCAPGVSVVNIDNGFGAGYIASIINELGVGK